MEKRKFGKTDMLVCALGFGGAEIGLSVVAPEVVDRILNSALDAGLNIIDTAECYLNSEELIGKAVRKKRDQYYLFTKCGHAPNDYTQAAWKPEQITASINQSLKHLKTDYLDLIQLHSCSEELLKQGDVITVLQKAKQEGKVRYIGYSGDSTAARYAIECGAFDSLQTSVNIADQESIELTIPLALSKGMGVIAKRPIANAAWRDKTRPSGAYHEPYWDRLQKLKYDFINGNSKLAGEMALRFTLSVPGVCTAIVGTTHPERWHQNAQCVDRGPLDAATFESIRKRWKETADVSWVGQT